MNQLGNRSFGQAKASWIRWTIAALSAWVVLAVTTTALAFGTFTIKQPTVQEADGRWKFNVEIDYGSKPHLGHIPFDFVFVQTAYYEYSITDNDPAPVQRRKVMRNQAPQREQMDISFSDARGELWRNTKFSFNVRRDRGFAAGEYTLTVKRSSDGQTLGRPVKLTLNGQNEVIDRRAMDFSTPAIKKVESDKKDKKPASEDTSGDSDDSKPSASDQDDDNAVSSEKDQTPDENTEQSASNEASGPPPVDKKAKSGCGCRVLGVVDADHDGAPSKLAWLASVAFGLLLARRKRNR